MTGYSGTPLAKKLGVREGFRVVAFNPPPNNTALLQPLPPGVSFGDTVSDTTDIVHAFCVRKDALQSSLERWRHVIRPDAMVWVSWPKNAAKLPTDITEDTIRAVVLPLGFVDVKVCAVDAI